MRTILVLITALALVPVSAGAASARPAREANLGKKADAGGPSGDLAGDISRKKTKPEASGPGVEYDLFRYTVELQLKEKRRELMTTLREMVRLGADEKEQPGLLFRLAELSWEESKYWFFEANRQEEKAILCKAKKDQACAKAAMAEKKAFLAKSKEYQGEAIIRYKELIAKYPDYPRNDEVLFYLGHNLWEQGKEKESLAAYKTLITRFPRSRFIADAYLAFGEWYFNNSDGKRDMLQKALEAYTKAASFTESRVYGFAIYKQGWCLYNLADYAGAADKFKATVFYGELAQNVANQNKTALIREARKDYVLAYSHFGDPTAAKPAFRQVGGDENWWSMLVGLAGLYYDNGQDKEAVLVYRQLIREKPLSPEAPLYQSRIVDAVMRVGNKRITVEQARLLVKVFSDVEKSKVIKTDEDRKQLAAARDLSERTLSNLAVVWHNEGKKIRDEETFSYASEVYSHYLSIFPESPKAYDLRFFHAELLYENLHKYEWAAEQYEKVAAQDIAIVDANAGKGDKKVDGQKKPGKWFVKALEGSVYARDEVVKALPQDKPAKNADPKKARPIPAPKLKLLAAIDTYLKYVPNSENRVEIAYKAAQIHYSYNHFDEAVKSFSVIALEHPEHELAQYSAHLVLDTYNILEDYEQIDQWARKFHGEPKLAKGPFKTELEQIIERNSFKLVAQLEKKERFAEAAEKYVGFVKDWPKSELADEALFNAAVDYRKAGKPEQAIAMRERLRREYPRSELAPEALYVNAVVYEEMGDFAGAAERYEAYAAAWERQHGPEAVKRARKRGPQKNAAPLPKYDQKKAKDALYNAGVFRAALGEYRKALKNRQKFLELWPRDTDAEAVFLSIADLHERHNALRPAINQLEEYKSKYGRDPNKLIKAEYRIARIHQKRGMPGLAEKSYEKIWGTYRRLPKRVQNKLGREAGGAMEGVATAHLKLSEPTFREFARIRIRLPEAVMAKSLKEKGAKLLAVQKRYTETVSLGVAAPGICALTKIGTAYRQFAQALFDAPVPRGLNEEQVGMYRAALGEQAAPVEAKAVEALETAAAKSRELGVHTECSEQAMALLQEIAPDRHVRQVEEPMVVKASASRQGAGLVEKILPIPPPPPKGADVPKVVNERVPGQEKDEAPARELADEDAAPARSTKARKAVAEEKVEDREPDDSDLL